VALPDRRAAILWLFLATLIWGSSFFAMKAGVAAAGRAIARAVPGTGAERHAPAVSLLFRFALASAILGLTSRAGRELAASRRAFLDGLAISGPFAAGFALQMYGLAETTATISAFLTSTYVLFVPAIAFVHGGVRPPARLLAGAAIVVAGVALLTGFGRETPRFGLGEALSAGCALAFAYQIHVTDVVSRRTGAPALTLASVAFTACFLVFGLALTSAGRAALSPRALAALLRDETALAAIAYTAVFSTVFAFWIMYRYQPAVSPARASLIYAFEPAAAAVFAHVFAGERLVPASLIGCTLILLGNAVAEIRFRRKDVSAAIEGVPLNPGKR
jgi:drug/metabolite transporter (DMT)-like permease